MLLIVLFCQYDHTAAHELLEMVQNSFRTGSGLINIGRCPCSIKQESAALLKVFKIAKQHLSI